MFQEDVDDDFAAATGPVKADFGAKDIGWQALGPAIACVVLSTCVTALRWYTRCRLVRCLGWDDYVILISLLLAWTSLILIALAVHAGVGLYDGVVETSTITKLIVANNDIWALTINVTKASILMQYLRVFSGRMTRTLCYTLLFALLPAACWAVFGGTLLCSPVEKLWRPEVPGHCMSAQQYWLSVAGIDMGLDFLVLLIPMPAISGLHLPCKQKTTLVLLFLLGFFVCGVSLARLATVLIISDNGDFVLSGIWAIIWSTVEANVGIICACLLALKPLIASILPKLMDETEEIPKHCLRLAIVDPAAWPSDEATLVSPTTPTTPTTYKRQSEGTLKRPSTARSPSHPELRPPGPMPADIESVQLQSPTPARRQGEREVVSMMDMLSGDQMV